MISFITFYIYTILDLVSFGSLKLIAIYDPLYISGFEIFLNLSFLLTFDNKQLCAATIFL